MPEPATRTRIGLFTIGPERVAVPLAGVDIQAEIRHFYAKVTLAQRYVNREPTPIEATYVFPLDEGAAVCGFEAIVDGTLVVGEVKERDKAFDAYDEAIEQGHGAFLLDEERPDVFQASIGNLPPGKEVLVKITYVTELAIDERRVRFAIPTTVSPRYAPAEDQIGTGRPDSEALNPPVAWSVPYGLNLRAQVSMPGRISGIECPSHPISLVLNDCEATVTLAQKDVAMDRDFVLSIDTAGLDAPQALIERDDDGTEAIGVSFAPSFEAKSMPAEVVFLVDRSGSMGGTSIAEARNALELCLRSMMAGCRFNIVGFGSRFEALFAESREYDDSSLQAASTYVERMGADLGGTELFPALKFVLEQPRPGELPRQVVIVTDGEVTNTDAVIALARSHAADARVFTFGIGAGASHHLVRGLARAGGGSAEFIYPGERIEPKVLRQFARLLSPALTDVRVEFSGGIVTRSPAKVPPVFAGGRLLIYGCVKQGRPTNARLTAMGPAGAISFDVPLADGVAGAGRVVSTLAARARIRELEEGDEWLNTRGSRQTDRKRPAVREEIIALSVKYGLISRETSFVAIERRDTPVFGDVKLRKVPVALTTGWGGLQNAMPRTSFVGAALQSWNSVHADASPYAAAPPTLSSGRSTGALYRLFEAAAPSEPVTHPMHSLIRLQKADGSWELTPKLAAFVGRNIREMKSLADGATDSDRDVARRAFATALALVWLDLHAADAQDEWRMLADKGREWLDVAAVARRDGRNWLEVAHEFLR